MKKTFFDASVIHAVLAPSLEPSVHCQIPKPSSTCKYFTSSYLRMEFLRRWICTGIEIYFRARQTQDIAEAINYYSHLFKPREVKMAVQWSAHFIESVLKDPPVEPIERFGHLVFQLAMTYDAIFRDMVESKTQCSRGAVKIFLDHPTAREALREFYTRFENADHKCKLNLLLRETILRPVMNSNPQDYPSESRPSLLKVKEILKKFFDNNRIPDNCNECCALGDLLVTLETPKSKSVTLYHVDHSFSALCPILNRNHKRLNSVLATAPKIPNIQSTSN